jgi:hypothetical protein
MAIIRIVIGGIVLFTGRSLYWVFVGAAGFVLGLNLTARYLSNQPEWLVIVLALGVGVIGAVLALFLQSLAVGLAGFVIGGYVLTTLLLIFNLNFGRSETLIYIIGGIVGAVLVLALFDWALIVLSSLAGATLIVRSLTMAPIIGILLFVGLVILGIAAQASFMRPSAPAR